VTAVLQDYDVAYHTATSGVAVKPPQSFRWAWITGTVVAVVLAVTGILCAAIPGLHENVVAGTPTANRVEVIQAAADRKAQAEADQRAADAAYLQSLDLQVKQSMQGYFDNPTNGLPITVIDVVLIKMSNNKYEGMANMQTAGHYPHQIPIHVTADDQNIMWNIDAGALLPLWY
jgi:hypothetical protein